MTRKTSPVFRLKCHRIGKLWRCLKSSVCNFIKFINKMNLMLIVFLIQNNLTCSSLVVYCWTLIHKNDRRLFKKPILPVPPPCRNLNATKTNIRSHRNNKGGIDKLSTEIQFKQWINYLAITKIWKLKNKLTTYLFFYWKLGHKD